MTSLRLFAFSVLVALLAALPAVTLPVPARAAEGEDCDRAAWPLAAERAQLAAPVRTLENGARLVLPTDGAVGLALVPAAAGSLPHPPGRTPEEGTTAAAVLLDVPGPERVWQITVSAAAWIDLFAGEKSLTPMAFTGVHACPGVRKSLRFRLPPGAVTLQVTGASGARIALVAAPVP
ncbi:hypothetical protein V5F59_20260 [Xanthobacter autotrophicus DSM 431]|uniref:hypothetical protein n=1 Tax=Xanthobacter nonsaccharivorans TaxID=3119912 RepID=UPI003729AFA0